MPNLTAPQRPPVTPRPASRARPAANRVVRPTPRQKRSSWLLSWPALMTGGMLIIGLALGFLTGQHKHIATGTAHIAANVERGALRWTAQIGFAVTSVQVFGRQETAEADILAGLNAARGTPILALDIDAARQRIEALPWVKSAIIERRLPNTLIVHLTERSPMAVWQQDNQLRVIDDEGAVLTENHSRFAHLPQIVGPDAPQAAPEFLAKLRKVPALAEHVDAVVRVGGRRWNLRLKNGIDIRLPEREEERALAQLTDMERIKTLFERDVVAVDMRLADRMVVQTSNSASRQIRMPSPKPTGM